MYNPYGFVVGEAVKELGKGWLVVGLELGSVVSNLYDAGYDLIW